MPRSLDEALNRRTYGPQWAEALLAKELAGFEAQHCFETVKLEAYMSPLLTLKPIFKVKFHSDGTLDKFKVRLVVGGHRAIKGQHFEETYSPMLSLVILRLILAVFAEWPHVKTTVADGVQAYLNSKLEEEVHVRAPKGMAVPPGYVLKVLGLAIYGLPQGGRNFWKLLHKVILSLGFIQSEHAPCFFYRRTDAGFIMVMTYVDDITVTITTDCETMRTEVFNAINKVMKINDCGVIESFLGMQFQYNKQKRYWHITQGTYIKDLCATMGLRQESSKACYTPEVKQVWSTEASTAKTDEECMRVSAFFPRSKVGSILWTIVACASAGRTSCTASRTRRST
jgi:hypothetical protein